MISCRKCGQSDVAEKAKNCPKCGIKNPNISAFKMEKLSAAFVGLCVTCFAGYLLVFGSSGILNDGDYKGLILGGLIFIGVLSYTIASAVQGFTGKEIEI